MALVVDCLRLHHHTLRLTSLILRGVTSVRGPHAAHGQGGAGQLLQRPGPRRDAGPAGGRVVCPRVRCSRDLSPHRLVGGELYPQRLQLQKSRGQLLGHSAYFNTAVTKQDFMKILGVSSQKWCKIISYYHGDVKQTMVYLIAPSVLILIKWDVTKQDFFLVLWLNHLQLLSKIIGYYHGNRE